MRMGGAAYFSFWQGAMPLDWPLPLFPEQTTMSRTMLVSCLSVSCGLVAAAAILSYAGPLDPPAGPVSPSYKTLTEVEPRTAISSSNTPGDADSLYRISKPGSYYLTGNILGAAGKCGIEIAASDVVVDLNGFELLGTAGMGAMDGITITTSDGENITIRNGTIRGWGDSGIEVNYNAGHPSRGLTVEHVKTTENSTNGMYLWGNARVSHCRAAANRNKGFLVVGSAVISDCTAEDNGDDGINVNSGGDVSGCTANGNGGDGISVGLGSTVTNCTATSNYNGFSGQGSHFSSCTAYTNNNVGFWGFTSVSVENCEAYRNKACGVQVSDGSSVIHCSAQNNDTDGIRVTSQCLVLGNTCSDNGANLSGAGVHATGNDNRIEGNSCTGADRGVDVDASGNFIVRNSCASNTLNWEIAANNVVGPIIDRTAPGSAAISGNSAPDSTGSTHTNANFTH